jgi:alkylation response protein AidB-like acyl-CoA dehydrogenase
MAEAGGSGVNAGQAVRVPRRSDFSLSEEQEDLRTAFAGFFERECPSVRVRESEPLGYDEKLWHQLLDMGVLTMGIPADQGGDGAGLVDLTLVLEQQGQRLAPIPLAEAIVAARLLAQVDSPALDPHALVTIAVNPTPSGPQLVAAGAVADAVIGLDGDDLVIVTDRRPGAAPANLGGVAIGWCDLAGTDGTRTVLATGEQARSLYATAILEWKVLIAAALIGLAKGALDIAVQYANDRIAFGVPIGTFQALSHPLADVAGAVATGRRMAWKAAWYLDHDPEQAAAHVSMAYLYACESANMSPSIGIHTQGGFGVTLESDMQLFFRRAKAWVLVAGDPQAELLAIADAMYGPAGA